jgi:hypothetical protein
MDTLGPIKQLIEKISFFTQKNPKKKSPKKNPKNIFFNIQKKIKKKSKTLKTLCLNSFEIHFFWF